MPKHIVLNKKRQGVTSVQANERYRWQRQRDSDDQVGNGQLEREAAGWPEITEEKRDDEHGGRPQAP